MYCPNCGNPLTEGCDACPTCGQPIAWQPVEETFAAPSFEQPPVAKKKPVKLFAAIGIAAGYGLYIDTGTGNTIVECGVQIFDVDQGHTGADAAGNIALIDQLLDNGFYQICRDRKA